jgi:hypothetical protein
MNQQYLPEMRLFLKDKGRKFPITALFPNTPYHILQDFFIRYGKYLTRFTLLKVAIIPVKFGDAIYL